MSQCVFLAFMFPDLIFSSKRFCLQGKISTWKCEVSSVTRRRWVVGSPSETVADPRREATSIARRAFRQRFSKGRLPSGAAFNRKSATAKPIGRTHRCDRAVKRNTRFLCRSGRLVEASRKPPLVRPLEGERRPRRARRRLLRARGGGQSRGVLELC